MGWGCSAQTALKIAKQNHYGNIKDETEERTRDRVLYLGIYWITKQSQEKLSRDIEQYSHLHPIEVPHIARGKCCPF